MIYKILYQNSIHLTWFPGGWLVCGVKKKATLYITFTADMFWVFKKKCDIERIATVLKYI